MRGPKPLTPEEIEHIRHDLRKYPGRQALHEPITYARRLLATLDAERAARPNGGRPREWPSNMPWPPQTDAERVAFNYGYEAGVHAERAARTDGLREALDKIAGMCSNEAANYAAAVARAALAAAHAPALDAERLHGEHRAGRDHDALVRRDASSVDGHRRAGGRPRDRRHRR